MKKYFEYLGLTKKEEAPVKQESYTPVTDIDIAERYLAYLKEIDAYQKNRRTTIENKNAQLVGQASIVASIFALFVPLLLGSLSDLYKPLQIFLSICFLSILTHYLLAIIHAIKTLKINQYQYPTRATSTITKQNRATTELDFLNEEISDLIHIVNNTPSIDNRKGENLIYGSRCFEIANIGFAALALLLIVSAFLIKKPTKEVIVKNLNEVKLIVPDTIKSEIANPAIIDTVTIKIDTLNNFIQFKKVIPLPKKTKALNNKQ